MKNPAIKIDPSMTVPLCALKASLSLDFMKHLSMASKAAGNPSYILAEPTEEILTTATLDWAAGWGMKAAECYFHESSKSCFVVITESTGQGEPISHWLKWDTTHGLFLDSEKPSDLPSVMDGDRIPVNGDIPAFMRGLPIELD